MRYVNNDSRQIERVIFPLDQTKGWVFLVVLLVRTEWLGQGTGCA
ncbi:hypothetical protein [Veronia pacifica]|nr:hypothetical protein [Veronia pacifica]